MSFVTKDILLFVENLGVQYNGVDIIKDVSLVERDVVRTGRDNTGQVIAVVGRSGRGKSTFFKALTGLIAPSAGKVLIKDFASNDANAARQVAEGDIGFVDQKYTLFRHKTVEQALHFALRNKQISANDKKSKIDDYISRWGLEVCRHKYPNELSGGQRQRVAIIEQLFSSELLLVMDEPFSGLDVGNILEVKKTFELLSASHEMHTTVFSTHDIELAVDLAQCIYVIGYPTINGQLQSYGTIISKFDLREMGIAWQSSAAERSKVVQDIVKQMLAS